MRDLFKQKTTGESLLYSGWNIRINYCREAGKKRKKDLTKLPYERYFRKL